MQKIVMSKKEYFSSQSIFLLVIVTLSIVLLFTNLGNMYLWQDEAETALVAKNLMIKGYPNAWDGVNVISQNNGRDYNENFVWTWHPWIQYYLTAGSFSVLGVNTFSARFPFAMLGVFTVLLFYFFSLKFFNSKKLAYISTTVLVLSIPFILHVRQCRWYILAIFSTIYLLYSFLLMKEYKKWSSWHFILSSIMLFHSSFISFIGVMGGLLSFYSFSLIKKRYTPGFRPMIISLGAVFFITLPWIIYTKAWLKKAPIEAYNLPFFERLKYIFITNLVYINEMGLPFIFLLGIIWFLIKKKYEYSENIYLLFFIIIFTIAFLSFMPWTYYRYSIALIPTFCLLAGFFITFVLEKSKILGVSVFCVYVFSNLFGLIVPPNTLKPKFNLLNYFYEISHDYDGPNEGIVKLLIKKGKKNQLVKADYGQMPIMFYTDLRAIGFGQDLTSSEKADWIIIRKGYKSNALLNDLASGYTKISTDIYDIPWGNRPDPFYHKFKTVKNDQKIVVYRR